MISPSQIAQDTFTAWLNLLPIFIGVYWVVGKIIREMPKWLRILHDNNVKEIAMQRAINMRQII